MALCLEYFYGHEAEQYVFFRIPKALISDKRFKNMSTDAKLLYGLMLDRMGLSLKNKWLDEENRVYIIYTVDDIIIDLGCARQKVSKLLEELDLAFGLIERKRQGLGKPNIIYVKNFSVTNTDKSGENQEVWKSNSLKYENQTSRSMNTEIQEVPKSYSNNTNNNYTDNNENDYNKTIPSYPIVEERKISCSSASPIDAIGWIEERKAYKKIIRENIEYDILIHKFQKEWLDEIVNLMVDVVCSREQVIRVNKQEYPQEVVKSRFLKINSVNIEYVYDSLKENTSNVRNIRAFLITTIYRSLETQENWYGAKVNYDLNKPKEDWGENV